MIRSVTIEDSKQLIDIYNHYIENSTATFEEEPIDVIEMKKRIEEIIPKLPWIVYQKKGDILGYAYASPWKSRSAYRYSFEISIYIKFNSQRKGIGTKLYTELIKHLKILGAHSIIGGITLPNDSSIKLHEKFGFKKVAEFEEIGFKFGKWLNVGYWQLDID